MSVESFLKKRQELFQQYSINTAFDLINEPGKYYCCPLNYVTLWELNLEDGFSWEDSSENDTEYTYSVFEKDSFKDYFPFDKDYLILWEDDYGFFRYANLDVEEYKDWVDSLYDIEGYIPD
jgi:hypothetical protein